MRGAVTIENVRKTYGDVVALDHVSLDVQPGEFLTLLGPSGCGKTTLLRLIAGFEAPDAGRVVISGRDVVDLPPYDRAVNTVFQHYALFPHRTVAGNVAFGLEARGLPRREIDAKVTRVLEMVRLSELAKRRIDQLSGGQKQRVALARAVVLEPDVLLLDEPMAALDVKLRQRMQLEVKDLQERLRTTFVFVTHDQDEALVMSDRIAVMNQGRIEQVDAPRALYARPRTRFVAGFIGRTNFVEGETRGADVCFDGFAIPAARFTEPPPARGLVSFSLRPQSIQLHGRAPAHADGAAVVAGRVIQRAYLGEHWDYAVRPEGSTLVLRVSARPHEVFEADARVWLELDPRQMALIE
jgi:iron(III) transport system ATP-binding protein